MAPKQKQAKNVAAVADDRVIRRSPRLAAATVTPPAADPAPRRKGKAKTKTTTKSAVEQEGEGKELLAPPAAGPEPPKKKKTKTKTTTNSAVEKESEAEAPVAPPAADPEPLKKNRTRSRTTTNCAIDKEVEAADPEPPKKKTKAKTKTKTTGSTAEEAPPSQVVKKPASKPETVDGSKTIIIEHCKQCNAFKTRAIQVKDALEKDVAGVNVIVNPEKPRRGCFEIREEGGDIFVSLLDMKRPFPPLKELDMEKLISDIVEKIQ